ncbi:hypothetical protein FSP39_005532 [Pinctada imbricata]|uniref:Phytanoyl-CoA dioxygenase n=1 Tax=Pinctada imbricata TaxID=66713 RepID=A0AA88XYZ6_PINIB|nr:hypothetical protein FSP39_005532 [Pinctada imbricata]
MPVLSKIESEFQEKGFIPCIDVLTSEEVRNLRTNFNDLEEKIGKDNATYSLHNIHLENKWVLDTASHPNVLKPVTDILGPNVILLDSRFICKYPCHVENTEEVQHFVAWHQDVRYWGIDGDVVTAWIAVDDADVENGCMIVIPGTHKQGLVEHITSIEDGNLLSSNQSIPRHLVDVTKSTPCPLSAGQASLHHGFLIHGSEPNRSPRRRCGYVVRYVSTSAKPIEDPDRPRSFPSTVLLCGTDTFHNFKDNRPDWYKPNEM